MIRQGFVNVKINKWSRPTPERQHQLVDTLQRTGNAVIEHDGKSITIRDLLIEVHMPLVRALAGRFNYHDKLELVSEGYLVLVKAIDDFECCRLVNTNISGYINVSVRRALTRFVHKAHMVPIPGDSYRAGQRPLTRHYGPVDKASNADPFLTVDIQDIFEHVAKTDNQKVVSQCIQEGGHTLKEMAVLCDLHYTHVGTIKRDLIAKFQKEWK